MVREERYVGHAQIKQDNVAVVQETSIGLNVWFRQELVECLNFKLLYLQEAPYRS